MTRSTLARPALLATLPVAAAILFGAAARSDEARPLLLALDKGEVTYTVVHKLHQVTGTSRKLEGLARLQPGGPTLVQVRASGARAVRVKFSFPISLDAFQVERPELLLIKIDDRAVIAGDVLFAVRE